MKEHRISRRTFLAGCALLPITVPHFLAYVESVGPRVRYDARSPQGKAMLKTYAIAVRRMQDEIAQGKPKNWNFQWYTHAIPDPTHKGPAFVKQAMIAKVYSSPSADRSLALEMWNTCRSHFALMDESHFLAWHRLYVWHFEDIVRAVSNDANFTLPYWDYQSEATPALHGIIPDEFRMEGDATYGSLFRKNRNKWVNEGKPMKTVFTMDAMNSCGYNPEGPQPGFNDGLDGDPHGAVHVGVGDPTNMGDVPTAAGDPIFWLHHCNIDRLWASWQKKQGKVPSFGTAKAIFADSNGNRQERPLDDALTVSGLSYDYDRLEPARSDCPPAQIIAAAVQATEVFKELGPVQLNGRQTNIPLHASNAAAAANQSLGAMSAALAPGQRVFLVIAGLRTSAQPGVSYGVYVNLPAGADSVQLRRYRVGTITFFDAPVGQGTQRSRAHSYEITSIAKGVAAQKASAPTVTLLADDDPDPRARPTIGSVRIVRK